MLTNIWIAVCANIYTCKQYLCSLWKNATLENFWRTEKCSRGGLLSRIFCPSGTKFIVQSVS